MMRLAAFAFGWVIILYNLGPAHPLLTLHALLSRYIRVRVR